MAASIGAAEAAFYSFGNNTRIPLNPVRLITFDVPGRLFSCTTVASLAHAVDRY
jgi:hypothetical protein